MSIDNAVDKFYQLLNQEAIEVFGIKQGNKIYTHFAHSYIHKHFEEYNQAIQNKDVYNFFDKMFLTGVKYYSLIDAQQKICNIKPKGL